MSSNIQIVSVLLALLATAGCVGEPASRDFGDDQRSEILSRFQNIEVGMSGDEVVSILGKPLFELDQKDDGKAVYYWETSERSLESHESPFMPSGIKLMYQDGLVSDKTFNHQWVNPNQLEEFRERSERGEAY